MLIKMGSGYERFKPHFNRTLGKKYYCKKDYLSDMRAAGLEPFRGEVKRNKPKDYKPSAWAHELIESNRHGKPGDKFWNEINKKSGFDKDKHDKLIGKTRLNNMEGGFI